MSCSLHRVDELAARNTELEQQESELRARLAQLEQEKRAWEEERGRGGGKGGAGAGGAYNKEETQHILGSKHFLAFFDQASKVMERALSVDYDPSIDYGRVGGVVLDCI